MVIAVLIIVMGMVGYILVQAIDLKSYSENQLTDLVGGLTAGRLLERDMRNMPDWSDPGTVTASARKTYFLDAVTIDGAANQPVLYIKTTADTFDPHNGDTQYVRWFVKAGILYREVLNPATNTWLDLNTALDTDLAPFEVLRCVSWTVDDSADPTQVDVTALIYPTMVAWKMINRDGDPTSMLANDQQPRSVEFHCQISQVALNNRSVILGGLTP